MLPKLWLKGQTKGHISANRESGLVLSVHTSWLERQRWEASKLARTLISNTTAGPLQIGHSASSSRPSPTFQNAPLVYTTEEKKWLEDNWRGEFHFIREFDLNIYNEEDREEGRLIARSLIEEAGTASRDDDEEEQEEEDDFLADLEADPVSHVYLVSVAKRGADANPCRCHISPTGSSPRTSLTESTSTSAIPADSSSRTVSRPTTMRTARGVWLLFAL